MDKEIHHTQDRATNKQLENMFPSHSVAVFQKTTLDKPLNSSKIL